MSLRSLTIVERRISCEHLVDENAQRPPIHSLAVALTGNNFRRKIVGSTALKKRHTTQKETQ